MRHKRWEFAARDWSKEQIFQNSPSYWRASCSKFLAAKISTPARLCKLHTSLAKHDDWIERFFISHNSERVRRETSVQFLKRFYSKILQISTMVSPKIRFISARVNATTFSCNGFGLKMNAQARVDQNVVCYLAIHSSSFAIRNASTRNQRFF